jgi:hypothetical protein
MESFVLLLLFDKDREKPGDSEYTEDMLAMDAAFECSGGALATGRRGIAIADILLFGAGGDSLGIGGSGECNDVEVGVNEVNLSLPIGAGADSGGSGSAFENRDRPLPGGAFGNDDSIPNWPAIALDQIATVEISWSTIIADNCKIV